MMKVKHSTHKNNGKRYRVRKKMIHSSFIFIFWWKISSIWLIYWSAVL